MGFSFLALARVGHRLLLRSRTVTICTPEGRLAQGRFPEKTRVLHAQSLAAVLTVLVSGCFLFVLGVYYCL
jgi:hypothetical protein